LKKGKGKKGKKKNNVSKKGPSSKKTFFDGEVSASRGVWGDEGKDTVRLAMDIENCIMPLERGGKI